MENIIKNIKEDIDYILDELKIIRNTLSKYNNYNSSKPDVYKSYRSMVDTLNKTYEGLYDLYKYNIFKADKEFAEYFIDKLNSEIEALTKLKEQCKKDYNQYRCLNDAYLRLIYTLNKIERSKPIEALNQICEQTHKSGLNIGNTLKGIIIEN